MTSSRGPASWRPPDLPASSRPALPGCWDRAPNKTAHGSQCGDRCRSRYDHCTYRARDLSAGWFRIDLQFERFRSHNPRRRSMCVERLDWQAKSPCYTRLSHREKLSLDGRRSTAYRLKESFGQLWSYQTAEPAPSSSAGNRASRGNGSRPTRRSRQ